MTFAAGDLPVEPAIVQALQTEADNRINLVAEVPEGTPYRFGHVPPKPL